MRKPKVSFSPYAWAKLLFLRDAGDTEVGMYGIASKDNLLQVIDVVTIKQIATSVTFDMDTDALADFYEDQQIAGKMNIEFSRILIHTHPGNSPSPSNVDEQAFSRVFGDCDWGVMVIVAKDNSAYGRIRYNKPMPGEVEIPVVVDYGLDFPASNKVAWKAEFDSNISKKVFEETIISQRACGALPIEQWGINFADRWRDNGWREDNGGRPFGASDETQCAVKLENKPSIFNEEYSRPLIEDFQECSRKDRKRILKTLGVSKSELDNFVSHPDFSDDMVEEAILVKNIKTGVVKSIPVKVWQL